MVSNRISIHNDWRINGRARKKGAKKDGPVELSFYMMNSPVVDQERIMEKANKIIEEEIGATLKLVMVDGA